MNGYRVKFYSGDYSERQVAANRDGAAFYGEGHANSSTNHMADYAMCVVATNASQTSIAIGSELAQRWGAALDVGGDRDTDVGYGNGVRVGGAGDGNLRHAKMPAVLFEPGFASNPGQAALMESDEGLYAIASNLVDVIRKYIPAGGLIAFSIGHAGKKSAPADRGAVWSGKRFATEAEFAAAYLARAAEMLEAGEGETVAGVEDEAPVGPAVLVLTHAGVEVGRVLIPAGVDAHIDPLPDEHAA